MDIDVEQRQVLVHEGPVVEGLMEGAFRKMFGKKIVGVDIGVVDEIGHPPEHEWIFTCIFCEIAGEKRSVDLTFMNS